MFVDEYLNIFLKLKYKFKNILELICNFKFE